MTQGKVSRPAADRKVTSIVGKIVWWNMFQIRQTLIDEYWWSELVKRDLASGKNRNTTRSMSAQKRAKFLHDVEPLVHEELGRLSFSAAEGDFLPPSNITKKQFAEDTGIDEGRYEELHARHQIPNVEELVAIARVGGVDLAFMFIPPKDMLESDRKLLLEPVNGKSTEIESHRWVLWIRGLLQLPEQRGDIFLIETSLPSIKKSALSGNAKRSFKEMEMEMQARSKSSVSAFNTTKDQITDLAANLNLDMKKYDPFNLGKNQNGYSPDRGKQLTLNVNLLLGHIRKAISMANSSADKQRVFDRFQKSFSGLHSALCSIITLRKLID